MSGDVQPRKRKEKRRKKDELGIEELRGTAAVFGEGDVLIHSYHEHGTGGHWCAKIIFFSLLAVLVTLIGLIILENRGLSELEANAVESRYSGVLDGWIEDAPYDDHHDEHTLELKHHDYKKIHDDDDDDEHHVSESAHIEDDDHSEEHMHEDEEENTSIEDDADEETEESDDGDDDQDEDDNNGSEDEDVEANDNEDDQNIEYKKYYKRDIYGENDNNFQEERDENSEEDLKNDIENYDDGDDIDENKSDEIRNNNDNYENEDIEQNLRDYEDDIDENFDTDDKDSEIEGTDENAVEKGEEISEEIEKIEREVLDEEEVPISDEVTYRYEDKITDKEDFKEDENEDDSSFEDEEMTEQPIVEQITAPSSKPFVELEDETSAEKPTNRLDEEEEYEKRQEQLRLEKEESSSKIWLKLVVGGALLVATHAVIRRSTAPRDTAENEANARQEETPPVIDRRMTLIHTNESIPQQPHYEPPHEEQVKKITSDTKIVQSVPIQKQESEEDQEVSKKFETEEVITEEASNDVLDKELYSDDDDEEVDDEEIIEEKKEYPKESSLYDDKDQEESETEEVPDDVEIIDDEQIEEEIEEEVEDEEDISDVDDAELLSRLEAKYGRLPEPDRPELKHKDGGNSAEDEWPGEPSDPYWRQQLDYAEQEIRQGEWAAANGRLAGGALGGSGRARWLAARALDAQAEARRDNALLTRAVSAYLHLLKMNEQLSDTKLLEVAARALDRIQFRGTYLSAEPVYRLLIRRFPNEVSYRNNLTISFLMANRADLAESVLKETLKIWPNDRVALAHYGFVLKTHYNKLEEAVTLFHKALENDTGPACEPRFYYHLGDALLLLGRFEEAHEVHKRGAKHGHFLSPVQRSLYNVERLKSRPWWRVDETPYVKLARALEKSWKNILKEGEAARALYEKEKEGLKEKGEWSQLDLFVRGQEIPGRCKRAPVTCSIVKTEPAAANCRRGQIKFSSMEPGTHVRPHVGPTNCRLRMHLGLSNTKDTYIRVDQETRQWQTGKVLVFDDSFEHEVWHNGTGTRLVLIVDVWHPHLTPAERRQLPAI